MSEKEKMLSSLPYDSRDSELLEWYHDARKGIQEFNSLDSRNLDRRAEVLHELLKSVGDHVWVEAPFYVDYGKLISIGSGSFINMGCRFLDNNYITIGKNALIGPGVNIYTAEHPLSANDRIVNNSDGTTSYVTMSRPVIIGNNVWLGGNVTIMPGVSIGDNAVVAAGSVVTKKVSPNTLVMGSPAKKYKDL